MKFATAIVRPLLIILFCTSLSSMACAERQPVLRQIDAPHHYYFREMYLPQVSSGPQSPAWSPDGKSLVYTMQGSLWRQSLGSTTAVQLTAGPGYDHQPDWSPDGRRIVFTRSHNDALELHILDVASGIVTSITSGGDVNTEPRWSPDGSRIAFVSTRGTGRFRVFTGTLSGNSLSATPLAAERKSEISRYYYSPYDHQISPTWTPDGRELLYVANPEVPYGTGSIWRHTLDGSGPPALVRKEETTWRARPDLAADGRRVVYSSYLGRQWHQLWVTTVVGKGEPFPLSYGDYDASNARWSPTGDQIAFAVNEHGNTSLRVMQLPGGKTTNIEIRSREYLRPTGSVLLDVVDASGNATSSRVSIVGADGNAYGPHDAWLHADDSFDRSQRDDELRYFHANSGVQVDLPAGPATITVWKGIESHVEKRNIEVQAGRQTRLDIRLQSIGLPTEWQNWHSGDVHVHMNYGGIYRNTPARLVRQGEAEDLDAIFNLIVNKEQRVPDHRYFSGTVDAASTPDVLLQHSQEFHTGYWGHLGLLGLTDHLLLPDYSAYPETAAASLFPDNVTVEDLASEQGAIAGYVHPFEYPLPDPAGDASLTNALPVDAALGKVDYFEVVGFADHRASADIWYRLLNCGFRISAAGGTDAMANYASLRGPVGMNRTYVQTNDWPADPDARRSNWIQSLLSGRSIATNGPLIGLTVAGKGPGAVLELGRDRELSYSGFLRSIVPVDKIELVHNGIVVRTIEPADGTQSIDFDGRIRFDASGWLVLRAWSADPHPDILDMYPYATTSPVYVTVDGMAQKSRKDAEYFLAWVERIRESAAAHTAYNSQAERDTVLANIDKAIEVFRN